MLADEIDTSDLPSLKKQYKQLGNNWTYGKVIERDKFHDPVSLNRSEAQPLQPMLELTYMQCCAFVHCDPASVQHRELLSSVSLQYSLVISEVIAVLCFFIALDKANDQDLINLKRRIKAFDINERILPKHSLPADWSKLRQNQK